MRAYIDGGVRGHEKKDGRRGFIAIVIEEGEKIVEEVGSVTNNQAEYMALVRVLKDAISKKANDLEVLSDSELLVKQIKGDYSVKSPNILPLYHETLHLMRCFKKIEIKWIPRSLNLAGKLLE